MTELVLVKVNMGLLDKKSGDEFKLEFRDNVPVDQFWRRRLKDSAIDHCMEVVEIVSKKKKESK